MSQPIASEVLEYERYVDKLRTANAALIVLLEKPSLWPMLDEQDRRVVKSAKVT